jgi:hypothetical protein
MQPHPTSLEVSPLKRRIFGIAWPSFLMAGVLEMLTFAVVDPGDLRWFGGAPVDFSPQAIYTITFLIYWVVISTAGALTALLSVDPSIESDDRGRTWPR